MINISIEEVLISVNKVFETIENEIFPLNLSQIEMNFSDMGIDSITFINLIVSLENDFDVEIPDEYLLMSELNCVKRAYEIIEDLLKVKEE